IQKLPVYSVLFSLVVAIELLLVDWIRKASRNEDEWLNHLGKEQRKLIEMRWKQANRRNLELDRLSCATFGQELRSARGLGLFGNDLTWFENLKVLGVLRDLVCHAAKFAPTAEQAQMIPGQVRNAQAVAVWLQRKITEVPV